MLGTLTPTWSLDFKVYMRLPFVQAGLSLNRGLVIVSPSQGRRKRWGFKTSFVSNVVLNLGSL